MKTKLFSAFIFAIVLPAFVFAQWSAPVNISPNAVSAGTNESMGSCIGVCGDTVHVVWTDRLSSNKGAIYYTRSLNAGLTWSNAIPITSITGNAWNPAIAVNGLSVHVVWREIDTVTNKRSSHYKHSLDGGNSWASNVLLDTAIADWPAVTVSGNNVYVANDILTTSSPYNTEIFFLRSTDNGVTWSTHQQITFSVGRSEDEAITAEGPHVFMSWNDNRNGGAMQIYYKHSGDYGMTWDPDVLLNVPYDYSTMVSVDGAHVDVPSAGSPAGRYQIHLKQSADTGATWSPDANLTNDTAHTYAYPYMVRCGSDLHLTYPEVGVGGIYLHSADGGATWSTPYLFFSGAIGITPFIAYSGCKLHIIYVSAGRVYYRGNPTGNAGHCTTCNPPAQPGLITGNSQVCASSSQTYSVSAVTGATSYTWTFPSGWTGTSASTSITVTAGSSGGAISVTANNSCGSSAPRTMTTSVMAIPAPPGTQTVSGGSSNVCPGDVRTVSVVNVAGVTYNWIVPTGIVILSGQGTNSISIYANSSFTSNGIMQVSASNACGTSAYSVRGIIRNLPTMPGTISGASYVCSGSTTAYSIAPVSNAISYAWSVPSGSSIVSGQGTTSISVLWGTAGGSIGVYSTNACGNSATRSLTVTMNCITSQTQRPVGAEADNERILIYPNPVSEELNIELPDNQENIQSMLLLNALNEVVVERINNSGNTGKLTIALKSLPPGVYFLQLKTNKEMIIRKIIKQ